VSRNFANPICPETFRIFLGAVQTFGDLIHWHPHRHTIVTEGVFTESGCFVPIPDIWKHRTVEIW
jgi:hypothetical protein